MSVILFSSSDDIYSTLSRSYEGLKDFTTQYTYRTFSQDDDYRFYKALRRLYFANVACFLCQYHDDSPLPPAELQGIETFTNFQLGQRDIHMSNQKLVKEFFDAWGSLKYNLCTNDGELYKAIDSYEYMEGLAASYARALARALG